MGNKYEKLLIPFKIQNMELRNRFVMSPMGTYYAELDGRLSQTQIDYLSERAKGRAGMIIPETVFAVRPDGALLYVGDVMCLPRLIELRDICKLIFQLSI